MSKLTLHSEFQPPKPANEKTLPEYYLAKANQYALEGRSHWMVDGITDEKRYFNKFDEETRRIASAFYKLGLRKGDVVIYMIKDLCKVNILETGVWRANGVMRATYPDDDYNAILSRVKESHVKFIVCEDEASGLCKQVAEASEWNVHVITVNRNKSGCKSIIEFLEDDDGSECPEILITQDDPAIILCTSGTTGLPKGAIHTHKSLLYSNRVLERNPWTLKKPNLVATKATHISGATIGLVILACGKTAVVISNVTQENIFKAAAKYKPGLAFAFPAFLISMVGPEAKGYDFSSIEIVFSGGVSITPAIRKTLMGLPNLKDIMTGYGLTEVMICTTSAVLKEEHDRETPSMRDIPDFSVGKLYPGNELQIRDPETLEILGQNQKGEICVKSPALFHSYLFNPEATKNAFVDGFFRTGDSGYFDSNGWVYMVDRLKEIFKYYNDHISPTELENVIGRHPNVKEVCVIGIPDIGGQIPRAYVTVHSALGDEKEIAEEIKAFANANLASYKHLRGGVYIIDELPKGKTGKITRKLVEQLSIPC